MKVTYDWTYIFYWINRDIYAHIREVGMYLFSQEEKRHSKRLEQDFRWGSFRYKVFQQELSTAFAMMCYSVQTGVRHELSVTPAYATYNQQQEFNTCVKYFFIWSSFLGLLILDFFTWPFLNLLFPLLCPLFSNCFWNYSLILTRTHIPGSQKQLV